MRIIYFFLVFLLIAPTTGSYAIAPKTNKDDLSLSYNVYAGGMHALRASLTMSNMKKNYDIRLDAKTNGFIGKLFPWKGHFETSGENTKNGLQPTEYESTSTWKKKDRQTRMEYQNGNFKAKHNVKNGKTTTQTKIKDNLTKDTVDMLTGAIKLLQNTGEKETCNGTVPVFDGKRRFNLVFKDAGQSIINKSKYSVFSGKALKCTVEVEPVLGFKKKDKQRGWMAVQNHTKEHNKLPTIWLSRLKKDGPIIPVRVEIASSYGTVIAHLTSVK